MRGQSECIKCKITFEWKRHESQISRCGIPKWCSPSCRRTDAQDNYLYTGPKKGIASCKICGIEFSWQRSTRQLTKSGIPKFCSKSCKAIHYHPIISFTLNKLSPEDQLERLKSSYEQKVIKNNYCWDWKGCPGPGGYVLLRYKNKKISAHRASWIIHNGEIPKHFWVLHTCDNTRCSNPDHLFLGTAKDNAQDRQSKNRGQKGETHHKRKLTEDDVIKINKLIVSGLSDKMISEKYKVTAGTIWHIRKKLTWTHII